MSAAELLVEAFGRVPEALRPVLEGLTADQLGARPAEGANTLAWLVWHLARVQDAQVAAALGTDEVWTEQGWDRRFALTGASDTGYGDSPEQVAAVRVDDPQLLLDHLDAVHARTVALVGALTDADLDRVVDEAYDPPVTLGARLVSVLADDLQHVGQAAYVRGLLGA